MKQTALTFTDSHCHLDFDEFSANLIPLLQHCAMLNIQQIVVPAVSPDNWHKVLTLANSENSCGVKLLPCLGIHPWFLAKLTNEDLNALLKLATQHSNRLFAIGECGIDAIIAKQQNNMAQQQHFFEQQIILSAQLAKPLVVHHRQSHDKILPLLKQHKLTCGGIIHAFSGSYQQAMQYISLGFKLGIGGTITYERAQKTINTVKRVPLTSLVLETDAPSMPLHGFQGEINSPIRIIDVFNTLCEIRAESAEIIAEQLQINFNSLSTF
jgi:TatD DNase family protein